jgi:V8-like Glu-specific endopeptidase
MLGEDMLKVLAAALTTLIIGYSANAMTPAEGARHVDGAIVRVGTGCSGSKIGPHQFLTARHCFSSNMKIMVGDDISLTPQSVTISIQKKEGDRDEDWAIVRTIDDDASIKSLALGCNEELYLGMPVAYAGFPAPAEYFYATGYVTSVTNLKAAGSDHDFGIDVAGGPGASGSAVISLVTGRVIGVLTEGIMAAGQFGVLAVGIESIKSLDLCDPIIDGGS